MPKEDKRRNGRENRCVGSDWPREELDAKWDEHKHKFNNKFNHQQEPIPFSPCMEWNGEGANHGYPTISLGHAKSKLKVHILSYAVHNQHSFPTSAAKLLVTYVIASAVSTPTI